MYLCHFLTSVDSTKSFASGSRVTLLSTSTPFFQKGDSILILILHLMRDLGWHRVKHHCSLLSLAPITFNANIFSCYGGSYFATIAVISIICRRPLNLAGLSMPTQSLLLIPAITAYGSEYVPLQNCLLPLSSTTPKGAAVVYTNTSVIFFQGYITRAWGMPTSFVHSCIFLHTLWKVGSYQFLSPPKDCSERSHYCSILQQHSQ
jgi:hypothetical protein